MRDDRVAAARAGRSRCGLGARASIPSRCRRAWESDCLRPLFRSPSGISRRRAPDRRRFIASDVAPTLRAALARLGSIELKPLMAQALNMGDEIHNRNSAATSLLFKQLAPVMLTADVRRERAAATLDFIAGNDHFFLNLSMAAC